MKKHLPILLWLLLPIGVLAQSVSPSATNEYCPLTNLSFTFTAPGNYPSATLSTPTVPYPTISSQSNNGSGVISATIQFDDYNTTQTIRLNYNDGLGTYADFLFSAQRTSATIDEFPANVSRQRRGLCACCT